MGAGTSARLKVYRGDSTGVDAAARARYGEVGTIEPLFSWCCISIDEWPRLVRGLFGVPSMIDSLEVKVLHPA